MHLQEMMLDISPIFIPPKVIESEETNVDYTAVDVIKTVGVANSGRLYLYGQTDQSTLPDGVVEGYRIGSKIKWYIECFNY